jgi:hypothetical protein
MTKPRGDAALVRHLAGLFDRTIARAWQALPYLLRPDTPFPEYLAAHHDDLVCEMPTLDHLPWLDCLIDLGLLDAMSHDTQFQEIHHTMQLWFRVTEGRTYARAVQRLSPWITPRARASLEERVALQEWVVVEQWEHDTRKPQPAGPIIVLVPRATPWDLGSYHWGAPTAPWDAHFGKPGREGDLWFMNKARSAHEARLFGGQVETVIEFLAYLHQSNEYLVEVTPILTPRQAEQNERARSKRPELRLDLPHWILVDPLRAREVHCPLPEETPQPEPGTHASPRPHGRRGHWRHLRAPVYKEQRRVWVRPTWVGPQTWEAEGQRYRVLAPAAEKVEVPH